MSKTLRPYQSATLEAVHQQLAQVDSTLVVWPTGMGKTVLAAKLMVEWTRGNCLFLAHTKELIDQTAEKLEPELGYKPVIEMNIRGADPAGMFQGGMVVVGSVQSMATERRLDKYADHPFGLIVIDEAHRGTAATYRRVLDRFRELNPALKVVGLTATPNRADGTALGLIFQTVAYQMTIGDAIDGGWLVPVRQEAVIIQSLSFDGLRTRKNEFGESDFSAEALEAVIAEEESLHGMAKAVVEQAGDRSTLVFMPGVQSAHLMAAVLNRYRANSAEAADGETPTQLRQDIVARFKGGRTQFLCNALIFTEGFDAPVCSALAMCRPTKSVGRYMQMLGRGLRPLAGVVDGLPDVFDRKTAIFTSAKPDALVLDFAGVSEHKLVDVFDALGGNYDVETRELAEREGDKRNVSEDMEKAKHLLMLRRMWAERKDITADAVRYSTYAADPFGNGAAPAAGMTGKRGGATDGQVGLLVSLGVKPETAMAYGKRQAGAVIDQIRATRCTAKQAKTLAKFGISPDGIGMDRASRIIDAIARNGWKPLREVPE